MLNEGNPIHNFKILFRFHKAKSYGSYGSGSGSGSTTLSERIFKQEKSIFLPINIKTDKIRANAATYLFDFFPTQPTYWEPSLPGFSSSWRWTVPAGGAHRAGSARRAGQGGTRQVPPPPRRVGKNPFFFKPIPVGFFGFFCFFFVFFGVFWVFCFFLGFFGVFYPEVFMVFQFLEYF